MKVLVVTHAFPPEGVGGTERYAAFAARGMVERGHQVSVLSGSLEWREQFAVESRKDEGLDVTRIHRSDLYFDHWDKIANPYVARVFEERLEAERPDVLHFHHWIRLSFDLVRRAAARGIPSVVHLHDLFVSCPRVFRIRGEDEACEVPMGADPCTGCVPRWEFQGDAEIQSSLAHYSDAVRGEWNASAARLAPTASHARFLEQSLGREPGSIEVLGHPDLRHGSWQGRDAGSPAGALRVLFFSNLHAVKGAHVLLEALRRLGDESGVEIDFYGAFATEDYEARLRGLAAGLPVRFLGPYSSDEPVREPLDVIALPSLARESHSFWLDEALATGLPLIVSRCGALEERAGGRALLADRGDPEAWARCLAALRDDPGQRERLRQGSGTLPLPADEHLERLEAQLTDAVARGAPAVAPLPDPASLVHDWDRREWAFRELLRSEGWEGALGDLHGQVERLRSRLPPTDVEHGGGPGSPGS